MLLLTTRSASLSGALVASSKIQTGGSRVDRYALRLAAGDATSRTRRCGFGSRAIGFTCEEPSGPRDRLARIPPSAFRPSCVRSSLSQTRARTGVAGAAKLELWPLLLICGWAARRRVRRPCPRAWFRRRRRQDPSL